MAETLILAICEDCGMTVRDHLGSEPYILFGCPLSADAVRVRFLERFGFDGPVAVGFYD